MDAVNMQLQMYRPGQQSLLIGDSFPYPMNDNLQSMLEMLMGYCRLFEKVRDAYTHLQGFWRVN